MKAYLEVTAKTEEEAIRDAMARLGLEREDISVEILQRPKSGFLGIGSAPAIIKVAYDAPDPEPVPAPARPRQEKKAAKPAQPVRPEMSAQPQRPLDDPRQEVVRRFLDGLLSHMGIRAEMDFSVTEKGGISVNLSGEGMGALIGHRGETLDAIQHLANYACNRGADERLHISVDAENYRAKREASLVRLAEKMAAKALKYHRSMALEPMNSYERHIIHTALQDYEGVSTSSVGSEPNRRVVVSVDRAPDTGSRSRAPRPPRKPRETAPAPEPAPVAEPEPQPQAQPELPPEAVTTAPNLTVREWR